MTLEGFMDTPVRVVLKMKTCGKCKTPKPATNEYFARDKKNSDGIDWWCKKCKAQHEREKYHALSKEEKKARGHKSPHRTAFATARWRVKNRSKYEWFLGEAGTPEAEAYIEYIQTITHCPDCAKELVWLSDKVNDLNSASFDRIDSNGDYTKENVRIVCLHCNQRKRDSPVRQWIGLLKVRIEEGIIEEVDPRLLEFLSDGLPETQNIIAGFPGTARAPW